MDEVSGWTQALGLPGLRVLEAEDRQGEWWLTVGLDARAGEDIAWCRGCGVRGHRHGRRTVRVRDLPISGRAVVLIWVKQVWLCAQRACPVRTWSDASEHIARALSLTERAREAIHDAVAAAGTVSAQAAAFATGWHTAQRAFAEIAQVRLACRQEQLAGQAPRVIGVDETVVGARREPQWTRFVTGLVDVERGRLLELLPGRNGGLLITWAAQARAEFGADWVSSIQAGVCDPLRAYNAGLTRAFGPRLVVVLDAFHLVRLGIDELEACRRRVQQATLGRRGRKGDPLESARRILRTAVEDLGPHRWRTVLAGLNAGDRDGQVFTAWWAVQRLRWYCQHLAQGHYDLDQARHRLLKLIMYCAHSGVPELEHLAATLHEWHEQIENRALFPAASNGPTEGLNLMIEKIRRIGHGFRNFENYRLRVLVYCGKLAPRATPKITPLRARPRLPHAA